MPITSACPLGKTGSDCCEFGCLKVEASVDESHARGQIVEDALSMCLCESLGHFFAGKLVGIQSHDASKSSKWHPARRNAVGTSEEKKMLNRTLLYGTIA